MNFCGSPCLYDLETERRMDQRAEKDNDNLWASLSAAIEAEPPIELQFEEVEVEQEYRLADRMAGSYLSGLWPLVLLYLLTLTCTTNPWANPLLYLGGVVAGPIAAFLFRPLFKTRFGMSPLLLALLSPLFVLMVPVLQLFPSALIYKTTAQDLATLSKPLDYSLALQLQSQLETLFRQRHLIVVVLGTLLIGASILFVRRRFPWVEHSSPSRPTRIFAFLVLLSPWLFTTIYLSVDSPSKKWQRQLAPTAQRFLIGKLKEDPSADFWKKFNRRLDEATGPDLPAFSPEVKPPAEALAKFQALETEFLEAFPRANPASPEELTFSLMTLDGLAARPNLLRRPLEVMLALEGETFHGARYSYSNYIWKHGVIPWLASPQRTAEELEGAADKLSKLNESALPYPTDIDLAVYSVLVGGRYVPTPAQLVIRGAKGGGHYISTDFHLIPMHILGARVQPSPTELLYQQSQNQFVEEWLAIRNEFSEGLSYSQKRALTKKAEKPETLRDYYRGWAAGLIPSREDRAIRETTAVYAKLLAYKARHGKLSTDLTEADISNDGRWTIELVEGKPTLLDSTIPTDYVPNSPWRFR